MRAVKKTTAFIVRPRSAWRLIVMLSLAAFGLTIAAVYFISQNVYYESGQDGGSKAVAIVEQKPAIEQLNSPISPVLESALNLKNIKTRVMSQAFIEQAMRDGGVDISAVDENGTPNTSAFFEQLRQGLCFYAKPGSEPGGIQIALELTLIQSADAPKIARALADRFVHEYRTFWATKVHGAYRTVLAQANQSEQARREAAEMLQAYKDGAAKKEQSTEEPNPLRNHDAQLVTPEIADNPAWIELDRKLASLREQEQAMLVNKTSLHPDVQDIRSRIADFEQQIVSTPRFKAEASADSSTQQIDSPAIVKTLPTENKKENQSANSRDETAAGVNKNSPETLKQLQDAAELAEQEYLKISHRKEQLFEAGRKEPILLVSVNQLAIAKTEPKSSRRLIEFMLCSGFAMAVGISVFSSGLTTQPVLATIADLEPLLPVPIIGVIPDKDQSSNPVARRRCQTFLRWTSILSGGLIVLGCMGGVYWFFAHLG
jgi:hypothetical protein